MLHRLRLLRALLIVMVCAKVFHFLYLEIKPRIVYIPPQVLPRSFPSRGNATCISTTPLNETCIWPPEDPLLDLLDDIGYRMSINYCLSECATNEPPCYVEADILYGGDSNKCVTFDELTRYPPDKMKHARYPQIYQTLPQDVNLTEVISAITEGRAIDVVSCSFKVLQGK